MTTSTNNESVRGKRYSAEEKSDIISFVENYNATNGRGGQSVAAEKFGVSQITISSWLKGSNSSARGGKGNTQSKLAALMALEVDISKLETELASKRSQFDSIKATL